MAIEAEVPKRRHSTGKVGREHAYDVLDGRLPHRLHVDYIVREDLKWTDAAPSPGASTA
jgi:hypothetical protein